MSDKAGHSQDMRTAVEALERVDRFLDGICARLDFRRDTLVMISDHGNIEDLSVKTHTRNPVPLIAAGRGREHLAGAVRMLADLTPALTSLVRSARRR